VLNYYSTEVGHLPPSWARHVGPSSLASTHQPSAAGYPCISFHRASKPHPAQVTGFPGIPFRVGSSDPARDPSAPATPLTAASWRGVLRKTRGCSIQGDKGQPSPRLPAGTGPNAPGAGPQAPSHEWVHRAGPARLQAAERAAMGGSRGAADAALPCERGSGGGGSVPRPTGSVCCGRGLSGRRGRARRCAPRRSRQRAARGCGCAG
jgi:hypothetical protein